MPRSRSWDTRVDLSFSAQKIEATDNQIDALVYELYGLTQEKIRIVEGT
jgi:hypothetical protein